MRRIITTLFFVMSICFTGLSQSSSHQYVTVVAEPDHADWTYHVGEKVNITAYAIRENVRMRDFPLFQQNHPCLDNHFRAGMFLVLF